MDDLKQGPNVGIREPVVQDAGPTQAGEDRGQGTISTWEPLRLRLFRTLWLASVVSNIGTWMQNIAAPWLMTSLSPSPLMVALVQAATSLPFCLLALPAGAIADVVDRRRLLLATQSWMLAASALLGVLTLAGRTTAWGLLTLTFLLGLGAALNAPAWMAIIPELVPRRQLPAAVVLNSVGMNLAIAVGPALGGLVVARGGPGAAFLLNAASFLGILVVIYGWPRPPRESVLPVERVLGATRAGIRYVRHAPPLRAVLVRIGAFILCGSALWALLPLLAKDVLRLGSGGYGLLLGCFGVGSVAAAALLPLARQRVGPDALAVGATLLFAAVHLTLACVRNVPVLCVTMGLGGAGWITLMSSLMVAAQTLVPPWVRARALAVFLLVFQAGMAAGSALWGAVAVRVGTPMALAYAALGLVLGLLVLVRYRLMSGEELDLSPAQYWPAHTGINEPHPEHGPVLIMVTYRIEPARSDEFARAMRPVRLNRLRDGALRWGLFHDMIDPGRYIETFIVESWGEHLRQHERMTVSDRLAEERARAFHVGPEPLTVSHYIAELMDE